MIKAAPQGAPPGELCVPAADPALREESKRRNEHDAGCPQVHADIRNSHPPGKSEHKEAAGEDERDPVGDGHGQQIAGCGKRHHRGEQRQPDEVGGNHACGSNKIMTRARSYTRGSCCSVSAPRETLHAESRGARKRFDVRHAEMDRSASELEGNTDPAWSFISSLSIPR